MEELNPIEQGIQKQFESIQDIIFVHEDPDNPRNITEYKKEYKIFVEKFDKVVKACDNKWICKVVKSYFDDYIIFLRQIRKYNLYWMYLGELKAISTVHHTLNLALRIKVMQLGTSDMDDMTEADCEDLGDMNTKYCQNIHAIFKKYNLLKAEIASDSKFENSLYFHANNKDVENDIQRVNALIVKYANACEIHMADLDKMEEDLINSHNIHIVNTYNIHIKNYHTLTIKIKDIFEILSNYIMNKDSKIIIMAFHKIHEQYKLHIASYDKLRQIGTELNLYKHLVNNANEDLAKKYLIHIKDFVTIKTKIDKLVNIFINP